MQRPAKPFRPVRLRLAPPGRTRQSPDSSGLFFFLRRLHSRQSITPSSTKLPRTIQEARVTTPAGATLARAWSSNGHRSLTHRVSALLGGRSDASRRVTRADVVKNVADDQAAVAPRSNFGRPCGVPARGVVRVSFLEGDCASAVAQLVPCRASAELGQPVRRSFYGRTRPCDRNIGRR